MYVYIRTYTNTYINLGTKRVAYLYVSLMATALGELYGKHWGICGEQELPRTGFHTQRLDCVRFHSVTSWRRQTSLPKLIYPVLAGSRRGRLRQFIHPAVGRALG